MTRLSPAAGHSQALDRLDDRRWAAVCARDRSADGQFVFAVATTGVFCRPSCGSRRARRDNVSFYADPASAQAAGFRACKRCKPTGKLADDRDASIIAAVCRQIDKAEETPTLEELAARAGFSPFHLHRMFKRVTGLTPRDYAATRKSERVKDRLAAGNPVTNAIYEAGYGSSSRFYESAQSRLGMVPKAYAEGGRDEQIRFALTECSLGQLMVAATDKGICDVRFGNSAEDLENGLRERFHQAERVDHDDRFRTLVEAVVSTIEQPSADAERLPLDIRGTLFQHKVWDALREIPVGRTASYSEVAARIGQPKATRAVARACAANKIAVLIPCHRVVKADRDAGGYRWGNERKRALLTREAATAAR